MTDVLDPTTDLILRAVDAGSKPRLGPGRIGASQIGEESRTVWLSWRWCLPQSITPRTRMIWRLGDLIEVEVVRLLREAGIEVIEKDQVGEQFGFSDIGGHYALRLDGVCRGLPDAPSVWHTLEAKSMAAKYFRKLIKEGLELGEPKYYAQCQAGMFHAELTRCLFVTYCKDTSEIYVERIRQDIAFGAAMVTRATDVATAEAPPDSTYRDRSWWQIKMKPDDWQAVYWGDRLPPTPNCRNCRFSVPDLQDEQMSASWGCTRHHVELSRDQQVAGCRDHNWITALVPADEIEVRDDVPAVKYRRAEVEFWNVPHGSPVGGAPCYTSRELSELSKTGFESGLIQDSLVNAMREEFGASFQTVVPNGEEAPF